MREGGGKKREAKNKLFTFQVIHMVVECETAESEITVG